MSYQQYHILTSFAYLRLAPELWQLDPCGSFRIKFFFFFMLFYYLLFKWHFIMISGIREHLP